MPTETLTHPALPLHSEPRPRPGARRAGLTVVGREVELVINGRASGTAGAEVLERATAALTAAGARVRAHVTADVAELAAVVRGAEDRRIVLAGGDGTVHTFANLDVPALPPAAVLPAGRANNIARALGIPVDWTAAAELAVRGRPAAIDALHVETPRRSLYAVEGVSAGFHAAARHRYNGTNSADLTAGVRALAAELGAFRPHDVALNTDGAPLFARPAAQVFLSNLPYFGFGFQVDPVADPADGLLEAIVLEARTRRAIVRLLASARDGRHLARPEVTWRRATRAHLLEPLPLVADAQPLGVTTATVTVAAGRLRLIAGAGTATNPAARPAAIPHRTTKEARP